MIVVQMVNSRLITDYKIKDNLESFYIEVFKHS